MANLDLKKRRLESIKITAIYSLFGVAWIYWSDTWLGWLVPDPALMVKISLAKGFLFIFLTALLLYFLINHFVGQLIAAEKVQLESLKGYQTIFNATSEAVFIHDVQSGAIIDVNNRMLEMYGYNREKALRVDIGTLSEGSPPYSQFEAMEKVDMALHGEPQFFEWYSRKKSGELFWTEISLKRITEKGYDRIVAVARDITERKLHEEAISHSNRLIQTVINTVPMSISFKDKDFRYIGCNSIFAQNAGIENPEMLLGKDDYQLPWSRHADRYRKDDHEVIESGIPKLSYDEPLDLPDGKKIWIRTSKVPLRNDANETIGVLVIFEDITDRKKIETELRESKDKFELTFDFSPDSININRMRDGLHVDINQGFTRLTGYTRDDVMGKTSLELSIWHDPNDRQRLVSELQENGFFENLEAQFRKKDGTLINGLMSARIISLQGEPHIISISRDITEHKRHEKEKLKLEKLESIGVLAGGIAHDFNNILTGIMGNISIAKLKMDSNHDSYNSLEKAETASKRAGELAYQLLTFARGGEPIKKVVSAKNLAEEAISFALHGSNVKGVIDIPDSLPSIEADEGQMSQVFHNIILNATQAMISGGLLTIIGSTVELAEHNEPGLPSGTYIQLRFIDQGCGIADDQLKKIFDPYFTTKSTGVGLGLASVYSIITKHGGHIEATSTENQGTTFIIHLPAIPDTCTENDKAGSPTTSDACPAGSILVMDDEIMIRDIARTILNYLGYEVSTCSSGEEAIELYKNSVESGTPFLTTIMDLTIPGGLGGKEAAQEILSHYPEASLIVSSGYSNDPIMSDFTSYGFKGAITKPYNVEEFQKTLNSVIN